MPYSVAVLRTASALGWGIFNVNPMPTVATYPPILSGLAASPLFEPWLHPHYDYASVAQIWRRELSKRNFSLWKYWELLPVLKPELAITMGEGGSPLLYSSLLSSWVEGSRVYLKDERRGPTHSFKDRQASVALSYCREKRIRDLVIASAGNAALAYSAYAARAGVQLWLFLNQDVPKEKKRECALYGAKVKECHGTYDATKEAARTFSKDKGFYLDEGVRELAGKEAMKTIAFEMAEQLGNRDLLFVAPDWYVQAVSGGLGPVGVWKGFVELAKMKFIENIPRFALIQSEGCAPLVRSFQRQLVRVEPVKRPNTLIAPLSTGNPGEVYPLLKGVVDNYGGTMESVSDAESFHALSLLARKEGVSMEPAAAAACAGFLKLCQSGRIKAGQCVVINCSGHTQFHTSPRSAYSPAHEC